MLTVAASSRRVAAGTLVATLLVAALASACSSGSPSKPVDLNSETGATETPEPTPRPLVIAVATPEVWPTPFGTSTGRTTATPSTTPTLATPSVTPTLAPISQLPELARTLDDKIAALAQAMAARDSDHAIRLQQDLLAEADRVEKALQIDRSAPADLVRQAIKDLRVGAAGDAGKLDSARAKLRVASGQPSSGTGSSTTAGGPQAMATSLQNKLKSWNGARQQNSMGDLLRLQQDLLAEISQDEQAIANQHSESADRLRSALGDLKDGLAGDENKLASASSSLQAVAGASATPGSPQASAASQQIQSAATSLDGKLATLRQALSAGSQDDLLRAQRDLLDEIGRNEAALQGNNSQAADQLRSALSAAKDGAAGDPAKLDSARSQLANLMGSQASATGTAGQTGQSQSSQSARSVDIPTAANDLSRKVDAYKDALDRGDRTTLMRVQQELTDQMNKTDQAVKNNQGPQAEQLRSALSDLRNALGGDTSKLNSANASLRLVAGSSDSTRPAPGSSTQSSQQSSRAVQQAARDLSKTLDDVSSALESGNADDVDSVKKELQQAEDSLRQMPASDTAPLRAAIGQAREALGGDKSKLDSARDQLKQVIPR